MYLIWLFYFNLYFSLALYLQIILCKIRFSWSFVIWDLKELNIQYNRRAHFHSFLESDLKDSYLCKWFWNAEDKEVTLLMTSFPYVLFSVWNVNSYIIIWVATSTCAHLPIQALIQVAWYIDCVVKLRMSIRLNSEVKMFITFRQVLFRLQS
jgi:hypothetical protein